MLLLDGALPYSMFYFLMINTVKPGFRDTMVIVTTVAHTYEPLLSIFFLAATTILVGVAATSSAMTTVCSPTTTARAGGFWVAKTNHVFHPTALPTLVCHPSPFKMP